MKRVTKGDLIAEPGYFYTPEEHKKVEKQTLALRNIEAIVTRKIVTKRTAEPVGVEA